MHLEYNIRVRHSWTLWHRFRKIGKKCTTEYCKFSHFCEGSQHFPPKSSKFISHTVVSKNPLLHISKSLIFYNGNIKIIDIEAFGHCSLLNEFISSKLSLTQLLHDSLFNSLYWFSLMSMESIHHKHGGFPWQQWLTVNPELFYFTKCFKNGFIFYKVKIQRRGEVQRFIPTKPSENATSLSKGKTCQNFKKSSFWLDFTRWS